MAFINSFCQIVSQDKNQGQGLLRNIMFLQQFCHELGSDLLKPVAFLCSPTASCIPIRGGFREHCDPLCPLTRRYLPWTPVADTSIAHMRPLQAQFRTTMKLRSLDTVPQLRLETATVVSRYDDIHPIKPLRPSAERSLTIDSCVRN